MRYYEWVDGEWEVESRDLVEYASGSTLPTAITEQTREGSSWVNDDREINITWHTPANADLSNWRAWEMSGSTSQQWEWEDGVWENEERFSRTYQANGGSIEVWEVWENGAWVMDDRYTETFDEKGNMLLEQGENWVNNQWVISWGDKQTHTYDTNGNLTETIIQRIDQNDGSPTIGTYQNYERWVFSNFQTVLSAKGELEKLSLSIYPNPTVGQVSVQLEKGAGATVNVVSLAGQTVLSTTLTSADAQVMSLDGLPAGAYLLQIKTQAGVRTQRLIKQ